MISKVRHKGLISRSGNAIVLILIFFFFYLTSLKYMDIVELGLSVFSRRAFVIMQGYGFTQFLWSIGRVSTHKYVELKRD